MTSKPTVRERPDDLRSQIDGCATAGSGYRPDQLRLIQHALGGSIDIIRTPADLSADFAAIVDRATQLAMNDVFLQVWTPVGAKLRMIKQFGNEILDLTAKVVPGPNARTIRLRLRNQNKNSSRQQRALWGLWAGDRASADVRLARRRVVRRGSRSRTCPRS